MRRSMALAIGVVAVIAAVGTTPVLAAGSKDSATIVIDGREFGPSEGLELVDVTKQLKRGSGEVDINFGETPKGGSVTPLRTWGTSYAISEETAQIRYDGRARAMGNLYGSPQKRVIQVCIWYERGGVQKGDKVCSNATTNGYRWTAGPEKTTWCWDDLNPFAPVTEFHAVAALIAPNVY